MDFGDTFVRLDKCIFALNGFSIEKLFEKVVEVRRVIAQFGMAAWQGLLICLWSMFRTA